MIELKIAAFTHKGLIRTDNEDTISVGNWIRNRSMLEVEQFQSNLDAPFLCLVADGMGGHAAGEQASRKAALFLADSKNISPDEAGIAESIKKLNREVFDAALVDSSLVGMGTTLAGLFFTNTHLFWFNVGDSRLFRLRDGFMRQLSVDDVPSSSGRNGTSHAITQAIGGAQHFVEVEPHVGVDPIISGWHYLACSDGLTDMVPFAEIEGILAEHGIDAVTQLVDRAMSAGGKDNISVVLVTVRDSLG